LALWRTTWRCFTSAGRSKRSGGGIYVEPLVRDTKCSGSGKGGYRQSSSSTVRNSSLCFTLYYTIHTTCFGLNYRPSSGVIYK
jgi:hypothetical protein